MLSQIGASLRAVNHLGTGSAQDPLRPHYRTAPQAAQIAQVPQGAGRLQAYPVAFSAPPTIARLPRLLVTPHFPTPVPSSNPTANNQFDKTATVMGFVFGIIGVLSVVCTAALYCACKSMRNQRRTQQEGALLHTHGRVDLRYRQHANDRTNAQSPVPEMLVGVSAEIDIVALTTPLLHRQAPVVNPANSRAVTQTSNDRFDCPPAYVQARAMSTLAEDAPPPAYESVVATPPAPAH